MVSKLKEFLQLFISHSRLPSPPPRHGELLYNSLNFLRAWISFPRKAEMLLQRIDEFKTYSHSMQLTHYPGIYFLLENYLCSVESHPARTPAKVRKVIADHFPLLKDIPEISFIFRQTPSSEMLLGREFLLDVLLEISHFLGNKPTSNLSRVKTWLENLPEFDNSQIPFSNPFSLQETQGDWGTVMSEISRHVYHDFEVLLGSRTTLNAFSKVYKQYAAIYAGASDFSLILSLLPPPLMDPEKMDLLSSKQLGKMLSEKAAHLTKLNDALQDKNAKLIEAEEKLKRVNANYKKALKRQKRMEKQLQASQAELQQRVLELSRSNRDLEQFAYVISHDLQAPIRTISSFVQILEKRQGEYFSKDAQEYMNYISKGAGRMQRLIKGLLEYAKVGKTKNAFQLLDLNRILQAQVENLAFQIEETGASIQFNQLPVVAGHELYLSQLFQNLFQNAIKFRTSEPPRITISHKETLKHWVISVEDNGIGIDPVFAERIFQVFRRVGKSDYYSGTGIGLAICKKIVELHGGEIYLDTAYTHGSRFVFTIDKTLPIVVPAASGLLMQG